MYNRPAPRADHSVRLPRCRSCSTLRRPAHVRMTNTFVYLRNLRANLCGSSWCFFIQVNGSRPASLSFSRQIPLRDSHPPGRLTERGKSICPVLESFRGTIQGAGPLAVTPGSADTARNGAPERRIGYPGAFAEPFALPKQVRATPLPPSTPLIF